MEEIVNSTPVMLVYPKATSKTQGILVVFQHENKVNHGYTSNSAHILWFAGIDLNGVLQWSQLLSGRTSVSSLAHSSEQSLREYFAERLNFIWDASIVMVSILTVPFKAEWQFLECKKDPTVYILWLKNSHESHPFVANSGSFLTSGVFR